jgi:hypothetical protein
MKGSAKHWVLTELEESLIKNLWVEPRQLFVLSTSITLKVKFGLKFEMKVKGPFYFASHNDVGMCQLIFFLPSSM